MRVAVLPRQKDDDARYHGGGNTAVCCVLGSHPNSDTRNPSNPLFPRHVSTKLLPRHQIVSRVYISNTSFSTYHVSPFYPYPVTLSPFPRTCRRRLRLPERLVDPILKLTYVHVSSTEVGGCLRCSCALFPLFFTIGRGCRPLSSVIQQLPSP